jgi:hypothetical protein
MPAPALLKVFEYRHALLKQKAPSFNSALDRSILAKVISVLLKPDETCRFNRLKDPI